MNKCEKIMVSNLIAAGRLGVRKGQTACERVVQYIRNIRRHRMCTAHVGKYCVFDLNSVFYTDSLPCAKRHALANRWHVNQDMLGWWDERHLKVRDTKTGEILYTAKELEDEL